MKDKKAKLPPRWVIRRFWFAHRRVFALTRGRFGLWRPGGKRLGWGAMCVHTVGRKSGTPRRVIVGYIDDGPNVAVMAMNGWGDAEPAWWLNVQAHPDVIVDLPGRRGQPMHARAAEGEERERLWARWAELDEGLDDYAALRSRPTAVVVFEPHSGQLP